MPEPYAVSLSLRAQRETRRLDRQILARIAKAIDSLVESPRPPGCLKVNNTDRLWRIRDAARVVTIITVGHRREFYD